MRIRLILVAALSGVVTVMTLAQSWPKTATGVITGRVTTGEKAVVGVTVMLTSDQPGRPLNNAPPIKSSTDEDGRYRLANVPAGQFRVTVFAPAYVVAGETSRGNSGRAVSLADGETLSDVNFTLIRGGVITGRITDPEGRPLIAEQVRLARLDERSNRQSFSLQQMRVTDDRGIYRIYGLPAGRYVVSAGMDKNDDSWFFNDGRRRYRQTWHPDATDETQARVIELEAGSEVTGADIRLREAAKTFQAQGRVIEAESGRPVPGVNIGHGPLQPDAKQLSGYGVGVAITNAQGEFRLNGLPPGKYGVFASFSREGSSAGDNYSDLTAFEIAEGDVSGLEVKVHRGAGFSGTVVIEGAADPAALAKLPQLQLYAFTETQELSAPGSAALKLDPQGNFRVSGMQPGRVRVNLNTWNAPKGYWLERIERDGAPQPDGLELAAGEQLNGIRVVLIYGAAKLRGQVKVNGGNLPDGLQMMALLRRRGAVNWTTSSQQLQVDMRGLFTAEGLSPGEYELTIRIFPNRPGVASAPIRPITRNFTISGQAEQEITIDVDLNAKPDEKERRQ
ncbi:MAG: carboxypeptidase regulatory-like domain-containing protein [Blastocatellia bacterium]